jgi:hypothetical protein
MNNIFSFTVSGLVMLAMTVETAQSQTTVPEDSVRAPLWQGVTVEIDMAPVVTNLFNDRSSFRYEAAARINLLNKYFPVIEAGYESRHQQLNSGIDFLGTGMFYKAGVDLSIIKSELKHSINNKFLLGARIGMSHFEYDVTNIPVRNAINGSAASVDWTGQRQTAYWMEIVAGIRIEVVKRVIMGWSVRTKNPFGEAEAGSVGPWYIPGFGRAGDSVWAFNYTIGYQF